MTINRRRAPSSQISSDKKLGGHKQEEIYAALIGGDVVHGTQKGDVKDKNGKLHSVKSGKKWQIFLYGYNRISTSLHLKILQPCLEAFPEDSKQYFKDRTTCISYKEDYIENHGRELARNLSNEVLEKHLGANTYVESKRQLAKTISTICGVLKDKYRLRKFLDEALFNNRDVDFLAMKDSTYKKDGVFKVFAKKDVLDVLSANLHPAVSTAGRVPQDYNVAAQKTLLCYEKNGRQKNIVEIEIRNDSDTHYRQVRFNMYSGDTLFLLLNSPQCLPIKSLNEHVVIHGKAINFFNYPAA
ncbi:MAG: hypothetical protein EXS59_02755 [Candidatus Taylorbacteria bacterium]|nr:hypothetical protein [Candidatus Taylorbacteria bacterium]